MRLGCAVLGATGAVGQRFVERLARHPFFDLKALVAQDARAGRPYGEEARWLLESALPGDAAALPISTLDALKGRRDAPVVFSALPSGLAGPVESELSGLGFRVFTNARDHRMDPDVPLLIPEVNADHLEMVRRQRGPGFLVANGNCSAIALSLPLAALHRAVGVEDLHVTTMQSLSGAGYPGVSALDILDNIVPFVAGEEEKIEAEPQKTLGRLTPAGVEPAGIPIHATATRAAVREGHLESVHLRLRRPATLDEVRSALQRFRGPAALGKCPTAPSRPIHVLEGADRPQPRRDRDLGGGMVVSVGRLRLSADGRALRMVVLGHNTIRGAAGQSLLNAEYALVQGFLEPPAGEGGS